MGGCGQGGLPALLSPVLRSWLSGWRLVVQAVWSAAQPVSMRWFQGQSRGSRSRLRRPVRMMRPATARIRNRRRLGSQRRAGSVSVEGQGLGPGEQVGGEGDDLEPDPVLGVAVEGQVAQPGVLQAADAVLAAGALPVPDLEIGQAPAAVLGCWWRSR